MKNLFTITAIGAGLAVGMTTQAKQKEHEEQTISSFDVPAAVQQRAQDEAEAGTIAGKKRAPTLEPLLKRTTNRLGWKWMPTAKCQADLTKPKSTKEKARNIDEWVNRVVFNAIMGEVRRRRIVLTSSSPPSLIKLPESPIPATAY